MSVFLRATFIRILVRASVVALTCTVSAASAMRVSAQPIEGWVVTAGGSPVADVVVLAHWVLRGPLEGKVWGQLAIMETTTDEAGRYTFPGWGPKYLLNPLVTLGSEDPVLHFFKPGYRLKTAYNRTSVSLERTRREVRSSEWSGKHIILEPIDPDSQAYVRDLDIAVIGIRMMTESSSGCDWKQMRVLLTRLYKERIRLERLGFHPQLPRPELFGNQGWCGSAIDWLQN